MPAFDRVLRRFERGGASILVGVVTLLAAAYRLGAQTPRDSAERASFEARAEKLWPDSVETPVLFSFSGGISLGAYQAGVNWAMLEFIRRTHYDPAYRRRFRLPHITVTAMTGASAGSINVLLGAVEYCDQSFGRKPSESMLWRMWVESGWDDLFPDDDAARGPDPGALDRSKIRDRLVKALQADMDGRRFDPACNVPIGVVATRLRPGKIAHDTNISIPSQRYVGLFEARSLSGRLRFLRAEDALLKARTLGAQLVLPSEAQRIIDLQRVFSLVEASSSYPIAFAPVPIQYYEPICVLYTPSPPGCTTAERERFLDGGVFDNNPVSLAVGMQKVLRGGKERVLYVDPDASRKALKADQELREARGEDTTQDGIGALLNFATGFIPSARSYELQSFTRAQSALKADSQAVIRSSTRAHAVIGEHLGAFAAFLGRPFREYDFYAGIADGMQFIASELLCSGQRMWAMDPGLSRRDTSRLRSKAPEDVQWVAGVTDRCVERETLRLASSEFAIDTVGRYMVLKTLAREYPATKLPQGEPASGGERARFVVLRAVEEALHAKLEDRRPYKCSRGELLRRALCSDGFDRVLAKLRSQRDAVAILRCTADGRTVCVTPDGARSAPYPDSVEATADLVEKPYETLDKILTDAFRQMRSVEKQSPTGYGRTVKLAELAWRSADEHIDWRYDGGPSSIPPRDRRIWRLLSFAPYYIGLSLGAQGSQFGWQPSVHSDEKFKGLAFVMPIEVVRLPRGLDPRRGNVSHVAASPSVGLDLTSALLNQISVGARVTTAGRWAAGDVNLRRPFFELSSYWLVRKLRASAYLVPGRYASSTRGRWIGTISIADVNGALYWMLR